VRFYKIIFAKNIVSELIVIILLVLLIAVVIIIIDERASRSLDNVDLTWDELDPKPIQQVPFSKDNK